MLMMNSYIWSSSLTHRIGGTEITKSNSVRNLGVIFDQGMTMEEHISYVVVKTAFFHIYNINLTRRYLTQQAIETLVHAYISSRLDYCNSLFYGLPNILFKDSNMC